MVWIWIIIAIIVIALIVWWLLSRRKNAGGGQATVGRHVAASDRPADTTAPGTAASGNAGHTVFDQEAHAERPTTDSSEAATQAMPAAGEQDVAREPEDVGQPAAAGQADLAGGPLDADEAATEDVGRPNEAGEPEYVARPDEAARGASGEPEPVVHNTGSLGGEEVVASGTAASDDHAQVRAASDARVAAENDDPMVRPAGAPGETAAEAVQHDDAALPETPVEQPAEGQLTPADDTASQAPAAQERPAGAEPTAQAPTHEAEVNDAVEETGVDPMTERFGVGAVSPRPDGSAPVGHPIKGNADSMLFHTPDSPRYEATNPAVWFTDEAAATSAGFAHWDREKRGSAVPTQGPVGDAVPADSAMPAPEKDVTHAEADTAVTDPTTQSASALPAEPVQPPTPSEESALPAEPVQPPAPSEESVLPAQPDEPPAQVEQSTALPADETAEPDPMREQFGAGAASPREDGSAPSPRHTIKGNADTMLFHTPDSPHYDRTEAEVWFTDEESAKAAGFKHWDHLKR
jgi:hypothetical protein